jgi:hypothetical protein
LQPRSPFREHPGGTNRSKGNGIVANLNATLDNATFSKPASTSFSAYESLIDHRLGRHIVEFRSLPRLHLFSHPLNIALHPIDPDRNGKTAIFD